MTCRTPEARMAAASAFSSEEATVQEMPRAVRKVSSARLYSASVTRTGMDIGEEYRGDGAAGVESVTMNASLGLGFSIVLLALGATPAAGQILVSANDGKAVLVDGVNVVP